MDDPISPIKISYQGQDADHNQIDLGQLGLSIQGAAKILGAVGHVVATGQYAKKSSTFAVRVMATPLTAGSFDISAVLPPVAPLVAPLLPTFADAAKDAGKRAVEALTNYAIAKFAKRPDVAERALALAEKALEENGLTSRAAIEAMERVATSNGPAIRLFVAPIGLSCETAQIGETANGAVAVDVPMREEIEANQLVEIGPEASFEILVSELDLRNRSCKFRLRGDEDPDQRFNGEIVDPQIALPRNPYSAAMDSQR